MSNTDIVPLIIAVIGAGGLGAFIREIGAGISKVLGGMSARESKRKVDIVEQRDHAVADAATAWKAVDDEAIKRRAAQESEARLRRLCIVNGIDPGPATVLEKTITKTQLNELREKEKS